MKKLLTLVLLFSALLLFAEENRVKQNPEKPAINDIISITYTPGTESSVIKKASHMVLEIVFWKPVEEYVFKEIPMLKDGKNFTANVSIPNDSIVYITYKFSSENIVDDNNSQWWESYIYDSNGKELEGGHYQKALSTLFSYDLTRKMATSNALKELDREIELYPNNIYAKQTKWLNEIKQAQGKTETLNEIRKKIRESYEQWKNDENAVHYIVFAAEYAQMDDLVALIKDYYLIKNPSGKVIRLIRYNEMNKEKNPEIKLALANTFLEDFPNAEAATRDVVTATIYDFHLRKQNNDEIKKFLKNHSFNEPFYYINIGEAELNNGNNIKELSLFFDHVLETLKKSPSSDRPQYMTDANYKRDMEFKYGVISAMKGRCVFETGDTLAAVPYLDTYYKNVRGERKDYNSLYIECLTKAKRYDDVVKVCSEIIRVDKYLPGVEKYYEESYIKSKGSKDGFEQALKADMAEKDKTQRNNLVNSMINKFAPDFEMKGLDGKPVKLADLKGKIVIIDFWAIWCGPCRSSLPYFQQAYEKYKDNKNVQFYAVNTWEKAKESERLNTVKSFLNSNNFTFPVLIDDTTSNYAKKLGIESIPAKFVIDQEGKVQFFSSGFDNAEAMLREIDLWIDILEKKK